MIPLSVPLLPFWLHNTASGIVLFLLSAHTASKVEEEIQTHLQNVSVHTYSTWACILYMLMHIDTVSMCIRTPTVFIYSGKDVWIQISTQVDS